MPIEYHIRRPARDGFRIIDEMMDLSSGLKEIRLEVDGFGHSDYVLIKAMEKSHLNRLDRSDSKIEFPAYVTADMKQEQTFFTSTQFVARVFREAAEEYLKTIHRNLQLDKRHGFPPTLDEGREYDHGHAIYEFAKATSEVFHVTNRASRGLKNPTVETFAHEYITLVDRQKNLTSRRLQQRGSSDPQ